MRYINNADKNSKIIQFANKNIIIHHYGKPVCSAQLVAYLLSKELRQDI